MSSTTEIKAAFAALERLEAAERRLDKEELLRKYRDNSVLQQVMTLVLGNQKFYVHVAPDLTRCSAELSLVNTWARFLHLLGKLERRELVGDKAKAATTKLLLSTDAALAKWLLRILDHNLRIGVNAKTLSTVWGKEFLYAGAVRGAEKFTFRGCMLSKPRKDLPKRDAVLRYPLGGEYKLDGERFLGFVWPREGVVEIVSRRNKRAPHVEAIKPFVVQMLAVAKELSPRGEPVFLDGEFLAKDWNKTASIVSRTKNFSEADFLAQVSAVLWDWAPLSAYQEGRWDAPWQERKNTLLGILPDFHPKQVRAQPYQFSQNIAVLGHRLVVSEADLEVFFREALDAGFEGVITKQPDGALILDGHRSALSVKHKPEDEATGVVLKVLSGKKKNAAASAAQVRQARKMLLAAGSIEDDGHYFFVVVKTAAAATKLGAQLRAATHDSSDRRVLVHGSKVLYRYGARLGRLVVAAGKKGETIFKVGGGFKEGNGTDPKLDQRMMLWRRRKKLVGRSVDFRYQDDPNSVAKYRFNKFVRFRDDL
jgi:ATP-dependent DNA ligase